MKIAILSNGDGNYSTKRLKEEAELRGMNFSAFLRMCMIQELSKRG